MADKSHLAFAIASWLRDPATAASVTDPSKKAGLGSAAQSIADAFQIDTTDSEQRAKLGGANLQAIFDVFLKTQKRMGAGAAGAGAAPPAATPAPAASTSSAPSAPSSAPEPSADDIARAESLKADGNKAMSAKDYGAAIAAYGQAIELHPRNPVYYSNRAAAFSQIGQHDKAIEDAQEAAKVDPKFGKAYSRLG